ncbi:MAG TPA: RNA polymerase sigma factor [Solirubrobacteraceae bacterium]|nr:RNA polymerase sigma factor [Solirubrobacteraceae bacterium]
MLDRHDITRLYDHHATTMLGFFARRTFQPEVAVDLVAETFAAAFIDRGRFRGDGDDAQAAWLYGIARNLLAEWHRRSGVERRALARLGVERRTLTDAEYDRIEELAELGALSARVHAGLAELSDDHREALRLRIVEERAYPDVADALGISEQTARARVSRALDALRRSGALADLREEPEHA